MSVIIVGGNECMERRYIDTCKEYGCKVKVFTKMKRDVKSKFKNPDLIIIFTNTISHKLVALANNEAKRCNAIVKHAHSSSISALKNILNNA